MKTKTTTKMAPKKAATKKTAKKTTKAKKLFGPDVYKRDEHGLLECVDYVFNDDGSVNWRAMIKPSSSTLIRVGLICEIKAYPHLQKDLKITSF